MSEEIEQKNETKITPRAVAVIILIIAVMVAVLILLMPLEKRNNQKKTYGALFELSETDERAKYIIENDKLYPEDMLNLARSLAQNTEDPFFDDNFQLIRDYPEHKDDYYSMKYTDEELIGMPQLSMNDHRWAYQKIGGEYICFSGCATVCITMAYIGLNHEGNIDPAIVAKIAENSNAVGTVFGGLDNAMVKQVCLNCGLECTEYNFDADTGSTERPDEDEIKKLLDDGHVIMLGLFGEKFGNHAVILRGYDDSGFYMNDPASEENCAVAWSFDELEPQIVGMWDITKGK